MRSSSIAKENSLTESVEDFAAEIFDLSPTTCYDLYNMNSDSTLNFYDTVTSQNLRDDSVKAEVGKMATVETKLNTDSNVKLEFDILNYSEPSLDLSLLDSSITTPEVNQLMAGFFPCAKMLPAETRYSSTNMLSAEPEFVELEQTPKNDIDNEHNYTSRVVVDTDQGSGADQGSCASIVSPSSVSAESTQSDTVGRHEMVKSKPLSRKRKCTAKCMDSYQEKRRRNNEAVRKSREKAKLKQQETQTKVDILTKENEALQNRVDQLVKELEVLKQLFTVFQTRSVDS